MRTYCIVQGTPLWCSGELSEKEIHKKRGYMCTHSWFTLWYRRNEHNIIEQLCLNCFFLKPTSSPALGIWPLPQTLQGNEAANMQRECTITLNSNAVYEENKTNGIKGAGMVGTELHRVIKDNSPSRSVCCAGVCPEWMARCCWRPR